VVNNLIPGNQPNSGGGGPDIEAFRGSPNTDAKTTGITASSGGVSSDHAHAYSGTTASTGSSGTNANLQPYITVFMWKRVS
jgi:hypothetical protein